LRCWWRCGYCQEIRPELPNPFRKLGSQFSEASTHSGRDVDHASTVGFETYPVEQLVQVIDTLAGVQVTLEVVAASGQTSRY
jgi:hypothetical protein